MENNPIENFFSEQLDCWNLAKNNFEKLKEVKRKEFKVAGSKIIAQFNPERVKSSTAKVDDNSVKKRKCFLCNENLPAQQNLLKLYKGFNLLVNPYPIFEQHYTIPHEKHSLQEFEKYIEEFLVITKILGNRYTLFFNGAKSGASAPDHMHFQAGTINEMPIDKEFLEFYSKSDKIEYKTNTKIFIQSASLKNFIGIYSNDLSEQILCIKELLLIIEKVLNKKSDMLNIISSYINGHWQTSIFIREKHRPDCYFSEDKEKQVIISPASVDMGGILILPFEKDYNKIDEKKIKSIYNEVLVNDSNLQKVIKNIT